MKVTFVVDLSTGGMNRKWNRLGLPKEDAKMGIAWVCFKNNSHRTDPVECGKRVVS